MNVKFGNIVGQFGPTVGPHVALTPHERTWSIVLGGWDYLALTSIEYSKSTSPCSLIWGQVAYGLNIVHKRP